MWLNYGLKAQQAHSPGHRPGYVYRREVRPDGAKASEHKRFVSMLLPLQGAFYRLIYTQGATLGYALVGPSARALNACWLRVNTCET